MFLRLILLLFALASSAAPVVAEVLPDDWAFRPLQHAALPSPAGAVQLFKGSTNPIDLFIASRLLERKLAPVPQADPHTLIRRLHFDLVGLPPRPDEVDAFDRLAAVDPTAAIEASATRLLASPQYGERWARHWLDVARFAESQGFEYDRIRDHAWRYRDYVIQAFNADKPYDQFIREQLAGDVLEPVTREGIVATGFLVAGPWDQAGYASASASVRAATREAELEEMLGTIGQTFLGVTLNCARCHDHKFDPIPQSDYYRVKAVFQGVRHGERSILTSAEEKQRGAEAARTQAKLEQVEHRLAQIASLEEAVTTLTEEQRCEREQLLADRKRLQTELRKREGPPLGYVAKPEKPERTFVLHRGEPDKKREPVTAGALSAVAYRFNNADLDADASEAERRRRFADWVASPDNPLTARTIVNRVWHYHFGRGLAGTPNDLGKMGERPSHPELLDWLAGWFVSPEGGNWSLKKLHRLILTSEAWGRTSNVESGRDRPGDTPGRFSASTLQRISELDADNRLLWRFTPRRLEVEAVRDAMLALSGELNPQMGGPGFRPFKAKGNGNQNEYFAADFIGPEFNRRTIYRICVHSARDPLLDSLDCPEFSTRTPVRPTTTTPLQALSLMNNSFVQRQSAKLAARVEREAGPDIQAQIGTLWVRCYAREPRTEEWSPAIQLARDHGLKSVTWAILNSSEFVFVR